MYTIVYTEEARKHIATLRKNEPAAFKKCTQPILELVDHPRTGTGHTEPFKGGCCEQWSRRITQKHRLVFEIHDKEVPVLVIAAYRHYNDR